MVGGKKALIAGPWVGEFGWELMSWQGHLRLMSRLKHAVTVICQPQHRHLYADFAHGFDDFTPEGGTHDCWRWYEGTNLVEYQRMLIKYDFSLLRPSRYHLPTEQVFVKYGRADSRESIVLHCRSDFGRHPERAWPKAKWDVLVDRLKKLRPDVPLVCIGAAWGSHELAGCSDSRGVSIAELCDVLAAAKVVVGASSGPMCLASLCGSPHVVWGDQTRWSASGGDTIREKFERSWNPLKSSVTVLDSHGWDPPVELVLASILERLR